MLFLMRQNIKPVEDPNNKQGGCFSFKVTNKNIQVWKSVSYLLTGETLSMIKTFKIILQVLQLVQKSFCI